MSKEEILKSFGYEIESWISRLQSYPIRIVKRVSNPNVSYEVDQATIFELEDKRFALVTESGCSCYSSSEADIDLFPTEKEALEALNKWMKGYDWDGTDRYKEETA